MSFIGWDTIYGVDKEHATPYMLRIWIGRMRLHVFYRGDPDPDYHDHPWGFWTFPLTNYREEVFDPVTQSKRRRVVTAWKFHRRDALFAHRVLGRCYPRGGKIITIVWRDSKKTRRDWGFWKLRDGKLCWVPWREYCYRGGKHAPCED